MTSKTHAKSTPAIRRATDDLQQSLTQLQGYDLRELQQRVQSNSLAADQKQALTTVLDNLRQLAQAEALRDGGGKQQDMFSGLDNSDFSAWVRPLNQRTLF